MPSGACHLSLAARKNRPTEEKNLSKIASHPANYYYGIDQKHHLKYLGQLLWTLSGGTFAWAEIALCEIKGDLT
jgi:hypothetical protein